MSRPDIVNQDHSVEITKRGRLAIKLVVKTSCDVVVKKHGKRTNISGFAECYAYLNKKNGNWQADMAECDVDWNEIWDTIKKHGQGWWC